MPLPMLPSFFKILLDPSRLHLRLPPDFVRKHLKNNVPENATLQSVTGEHSWSLKIKKVDRIYSFADGWNKVVEDTQLVFGDFLVFSLVDQSTFKVSIFGTNGCQKDFPSKIKVEHEDEDDEEQKEDQEEQADDDDDINRDEVDPFFMAIISKHHNHYLALSMGFLRVAGINEERVITIKNLHGKEWRLKLHESKSRRCKRYYLSSGWSVFRRANELSEGDECVIKFIRSEDKLCLAKVTKKRVPASRPTVKAPGTEVKKRPVGRPPRVEVVGKDEGGEVVKRSRGRPRKKIN